jgi:phospholipid/cholesterol/gamma-HCH transport system substrate-binding protein
MKKWDAELSVGVFILAGLVCLSYLSIRLGKMEVLGSRGYEVSALFSNSGGLKTGAPVVIAGVDVGRVKSVTLDNYQARISLTLTPGVTLHEDAIASIKTKGLIGEKFVDIAPGGSEKVIPPGGQIRETQPPVDLEELIANVVFGKI